MAKLIVLGALLMTACTAPELTTYSGPSIVCVPASIYDRSGVLICH